MENLTILPNELLLLITSLLNIGSTFSLSRACKSLLTMTQKKCKVLIDIDIHTILIDIICNNDTKLFKWLVPDVNLLQSKHTDEYYYHVTISGNLDILKYLHENECPRKMRGDVSSCRNAVRYGHLEMLKYLHENGCFWDSNSIACDAAIHGHLEVLKYLHKNGCNWTGNNWDEYICTNVAKKGYLEVLKYLHENGCYWDIKACVEAAQDSDRPNILKYLHEEN